MVVAVIWTWAFQGAGIASLQHFGLLSFAVCDLLSIELFYPVSVDIRWAHFTPSIEVAHTHRYIYIYIIVWKFPKCDLPDHVTMLSISELRFAASAGMQSPQTLGLRLCTLIKGIYVNLRSEEPSRTYCTSTSQFFMCRISEFTKFNTLHHCRELGTCWTSASQPSQPTDFAERTANLHPWICFILSMWTCGCC